MVSIRSTIQPTNTFAVSWRLSRKVLSISFLMTKENYPDSLKLRDLAKETYSLKKKLEEAKATKSGDPITKGALQLRNDI